MREGLNYNFSIRTLEVGGFIGALEALRLPFGKDVRSTLHFESERKDTPIEFENGLKGDGGFWYESQILVDQKDIDLMSTLIKRGDEHAKVVRGIVAWCEIEAPRYFWQECDTYRIGGEKLGSNSTMHQQGHGLFTQELIDMKEELPEGTLQKRVWYFSYQTLRRIYKQRHNHRLPHWWDFCDWIKTLPYAEELILVGLEDNKE